MPSTITVNGQTTGVPAVIGAPDFSNNSQVTPTFKALAVVGSFPFLQAATPYAATSQRGLESIAPKDEELKRVSNIIYNPSNDPRVTGSPPIVYLVNAGTCTQASLELKTGSSTEITVKPTVWGPLGNRTFLSLSSDSQHTNKGAWADSTAYDLKDVVSDGDRLYICTLAGTSSGTGVDDDSGVSWSEFQSDAGWSFTVQRNGATASGAGIGSAPALSLATPGAHGNFSATADLSATGLQISFSHSALAAGTYSIGNATLDPTELAIDGTPSAQVSATLSGEVVTVVLSGTLKSTGLAGTSTITVPDGHNPANDAAVAGDNALSSVTSITISGTGGWSGTVTLSGVAIDLPVSERDWTIAEAVQEINNYASKGYVAGSRLPNQEGILLRQLDDATTGTISTDFASPTNLYATLQQLTDALNATGLVTATLASDAPTTVSDVALTNFGGGTASAATSDSWKAAVDSLEVYDVNVISMLTTNATYIDHGVTHAAKMNGVGANERSVRAGVPAGSSVDAIRTFSRNRGSEYLSLCWEDGKRPNYRGREEVLGPEYVALAAAATQCSLPVGEPINGKRPGFTAFSNSANIDVAASLEDLIQASVTTFIDDANGIKCVRDLTTFATNDDPGRTEVSARESMMATIRFVRSGVQAVVGTGNFKSTASRVRNLIRTQMDRAVQADVCKDWDEKSLTVEDNGVYFVVSCDMEPVYPVLGVVFNPRVRQINFQLFI